MSDFLASLISRNMREASGLQPRPTSLFEMPRTESSWMPEISAAAKATLTVRAEENENSLSTESWPSFGAAPPATTPKALPTASAPPPSVFPRTESSLIVPALPDSTVASVPPTPAPPDQATYVEPPGRPAVRANSPRAARQIPPEPVTHLSKGDPMRGAAPADMRPSNPVQRAESGLVPLNAIGTPHVADADPSIEPDRISSELEMSQAKAKLSPRVIKLDAVSGPDLTQEPGKRNAGTLGESLSHENSIHFENPRGTPHLQVSESTMWLDAPAPLIVPNVQKETELRGARQKQEPRETVIRISIGRIEVRTVPPVSSPLPPRLVEAKPQMSLDDYLRARNGAKP